MSDQQTGVIEKWRAVRGWVPWLFAGVYFPLYVTLDYVAGDVIATGADLPRSVGVAVFSLSVALVVTAAVTVSRLDRLPLPRSPDWLGLGGRGGTGERSTVGSSGAVDRKTVRTSMPATGTPGATDVGETSTDGGTDDEGAAAGEESGEWPDEWIPGDQL